MVRFLERYSLGRLGWGWGLLLSIALIAAETGLRWAMLAIDQGPPFLYYYPGMWISAYFGGLVPGLFCAVASIATALILWVEPRWSFAGSPDLMARAAFNGANGVAAAIAMHHLQKTVIALAKARETADLLRREVSHRVGNNLQIALAICSMQTRVNGPSPGIDEVMGRLSAPGKIHYLMQDEVMQFDAHLLRRVLASALEPSGKAVVSVNPEIVLHRDQIQPLLLILHELAADTLRDAEKPAHITVTLSREEEDVILTYYDRSAGEPREGLGMRIVERLAKQLSGTVRFGTGPKARIVIPPASNGLANSPYPIDASPPADIRTSPDHYRV